MAAEAPAAESSEDVLTSVDGAVGVVRLNRPKALNALSYGVMQKIVDAFEAYDRDPAVRCILLTGNDRAFAAGADIKELENATVVEMASSAQMERWDRIRRVSKPIVAAVSGFALGGGCELAMCCDIIVASETAVFGQPEVDIGVMPGAGGTQRLTRAVGKALAMDMVLTGRRIDAKEALAHGLVSRVMPIEAYFDEAMKVSRAVAAKAPVAARMAKEGVARALDMSLETALSYERRLFYLLFGTEDQKEGMAAFREKRKPEYTGK
jgi:enoyl-CoA hydratase